MKSVFFVLFAPLVVWDMLHNMVDLGEGGGMLFEGS